VFCFLVLLTPYLPTGSQQFSAMRATCRPSEARYMSRISLRYTESLCSLSLPGRINSYKLRPHPRRSRCRLARPAKPSPRDENPAAVSSG
jgi:hypothetical protein